MSSASMSDAADTPLSGSIGSPSPQSPGSTQILDFSKKEKDFPETDDVSSRIAETTESERSVNSSPATLVPTPRSTPPMNGILTPPNDVDGGIEPPKNVKPGGRLKFFKDGVLCLELTHHGEGERTKWVQIRSKTVFPTLVHTVKEATIPCHSTPSSFASPSSLSHNHRVESSTSHSLSDDACSMLSSPRARESHWKQPVPQRGAAACLQFYFKPAPCALKVRGKLKQLSLSQDKVRKRWPYNFRRTDIFIKLKNSVQCCCDEKSRVLTNSCNSGNNNNESGDESNLKESKELRNGVSASKPSSSEKTSLFHIIERLGKAAASHVKQVGSKEGKSNSEASDSSAKKASMRQPVVTPKKRLFNELDSKEPGGVRPKKKSPNRSHDVVRTILNVPGLNSEFYKRHASPKAARHPGQNSSFSPTDAIDSRSKAIIETAFDKRSPCSPHFGAKSISPGASGSCSMVKPGLSAELVDHLLPLSGRNPSKVAGEHASSKYMQGHPLVPSNMHEQKYLQQQTVSKAISYTINSLLGNAAVVSESSAGSLSKRLQQIPLNQNHQKETQKERKSHSPIFPNTHQRGNVRQSPSRNLGNARPEHDQKSFLRHLLDTSDPIPSNSSAKVIDRPSKNMSHSNSVNHNNNNNSVVKAPKVNIHQEGAVNSTYSASNKHVNKYNATHGSPGIDKDSLTPDAQQSLAANLALSSLLSTFPLGLSQPYDVLGRSPNANHATDALTAAAAAAAALQYGSILPGNLFTPVSNPMAAAMAASYFGMMSVPNFPAATSAPTPPSNSKSSSLKVSARRNQEPSIHNQRISQHGTTNGHPSHSSPTFINATSTPLNSRNMSRPSAISPPVESGALNLSSKKKSNLDESIDMDAPLDLCKKSSG